MKWRGNPNAFAVPKGVGTRLTFLSVGELEIASYCIGPPVHQSGEGGLTLGSGRAGRGWGLVNTGK